MIKILEKSAIYIYILICLMAHLSYLIPEYVTLILAVLLILFAFSLFISSYFHANRILFLLVFLMVLLPSAFNSEEENVIIPLFFFISPFLPFILIPQFFINHFDKYLLSMKIGIILAVLGVAVQIFISPDLFGVPGHPTYSGELMGTSSFRPTGFTGSPQNLALFMSVGLFLRYTNCKIINLVIKISIFITGASTLATFFAGAAFVYLLFKFTLVFVLAAPFLFVYLWSSDFANTPLEFLSISEIGNIDERYKIDNFFDSSLFEFLFGFGPGTATQGMIDRFFVQRNLYEAESMPLVVLHEFGLLFFLFVLFFILKAIYNSYLIWRIGEYKEVNFLAISLILVASLLLTPNFASFRVKLMFIPFLIISLNSILHSKAFDYFLSGKSKK
jgi:hypothetical protein